MSSRTKKTARPEKAATPVALPRYVMIGGFLGAGKTTAVSKLARYLSSRGRRVGLITNDQGNQLVDTTFLRSSGFDTEEISGGCFCCRFNSLVEAAEKLSQKTRPDVFIAEPVGSCTDLVATVSFPLRRIYGGRFSVAPLSVLVDPIRALRIFGAESGGKFSDKVIYIYRKQLEEADFIVINKIDLLDVAQRKSLQKILRQNFPRAEIFEISARRETGLVPWFERIADDGAVAGVAPPIDYEIYAEGEALLGWLNGVIHLRGKTEFDGNDFLRQLAGEIQRRVIASGGAVAHLKMTLEPDGGLADLGVINLVRNDAVAEMSHEFAEVLDEGRLTVNLRAECSPDDLRAAVENALQKISSIFSIKTRLDQMEHFRPGKPTPTHRMTAAG
jgi:Ni2+-binding GTPase involved in maturation of urease and hydrogenase